MKTDITRDRKAAISSARLLLVAGTCAAALIGGRAFAADAATGAVGTVAGSGSEATNVDELIVTAERNQAAAAAPTKASLDETQPESIVSHKFIEAFTPENGDYTTVLLIAPSMAGISSNGGGIGDTNKTTLRGFQDGQYNLTYDGIAFGDTNDPTHHPADYFPASEIGAAVVDRGPGTAGDLGQANYGGAIHLFSPALSDTFDVDQKGTYGTWNTFQSITQIQSGEIAATGGTKALALFDYRGSDSELSGTSGLAYDAMLKVQQPLGPRASVTLFSSAEYTRFFQSDANLGETWQQVQLYGKNFSLSRSPSSGEFWDAYNNEKKNTDFEYVKLNYDFGHGFTLENQGYTYFYSNKTISVNDNSGLLDGPNTATPKDKAYPTTDIGGYNKANRYRVYGDIVRFNKDFAFGTLKVGALFEGSDTDRHNILFDLTTGLPDLDAKYAKADPALPVADSNIKTLETSSWRQYQLFADFIWRPTDKLTISPGFKYVNFTRTIGGTGDSFPGVAPLDCSIENSVEGAETRSCISGTNTYDKPLYFGTINYKITPNWSVYAQTATGFLIPSLSYLYSDNLSLQNLKPTETTNYQGGTVFSQGRITADADIYKIFVTDQEIANAACQCYVNGGNAHYSGVEGELAYAFPHGLTLFANASLNTAKNTTADMTEPDAPKWTDAVGALYSYRRMQASVTWKEVGSQVEYTAPAAETAPDGAVLLANQERQIGAYNTINASVAYDFGHFKMKLAAFNLADHRAITSITGSGVASDYYTFQAGREILLTLEAKWR
jgi:iron complex outermembrane receptor protein